MKQDVLGKDAFPNVNPSSMGPSLTFLGTYKSLLIYCKKSGIAKSIAAIFVWLIEKEREASNSGPVKYHGKWSFKRVSGIQPASVALFGLNLAMHFHGWMSFAVLLYSKMPLRKGKTVYYEYATLWHIFAFISMTSWFWSAVFHCRDVELTEKLHYSSARASIGFSLIMSNIGVSTSSTRLPESWLEYESLCSYGCGATDYLGSLGWCHMAPFVLEALFCS